MSTRRSKPANPPMPEPASLEDGTEPSVPVSSPEMIAEAEGAEAATGVDWLRDMPDVHLSPPGAPDAGQWSAKRPAATTATDTPASVEPARRRGRVKRKAASDEGQAADGFAVIREAVTAVTTDVQQATRAARREIEQLASAKLGALDIAAQQAAINLDRHRQ